MSKKQIGPDATFIFYAMHARKDFFEFKMIGDLASGVDNVQRYVQRRSENRFATWGRV